LSYSRIIRGFFRRCRCGSIFILCFVFHGARIIQSIR
jgi:hypothetical protein